MPDNYDGYRRLSEAVDTRIAAGEEESNRASFLELMDRGKVDVVQVDLTRVGGFTEAVKIASLAHDRGLPVANHGFTTYINVAAALHFLNSVPNSLIVEYVAEEATTLPGLRHQTAHRSARRLFGNATGARVGSGTRRGSVGAICGAMSTSTRFLGPLSLASLT